MLKVAFNAVTRLHSRSALLKRLGSPDIYSPCRITPSNYFRFLRGPEYATIKGVEYILPLDSMSGQFSQTLSFSEVPDAGTFKLKFGSDSTDPLNYDASAADIQTALRALAPLASVVVSGDASSGFVILFQGSSSAYTLGEVTNSTLTASSVAVTPTVIHTFAPWDTPIKKGDRIVDGSKSWTVDEVIEMYDLGAQVMGYRCRAD